MVEPSLEGPFAGAEGLAAGGPRKRKGSADARAGRSRPAARARVYRFKVQLEAAGGPWRTIEVRGDQTLETLHQAIQVAFDWDDDHRCAFYLSGKYGDEESCYVGPSFIENDELEGGSRRTHRAVLDRLSLYRGKSFAYLFDFGDQWRHRIKILEIAPAQEDEDYPRIVEQSGEAPDQYPCPEGDGERRPARADLLRRMGAVAPLAERAGLEVKNALLQEPSRGRLLRQHRLALQLSDGCGRDRVMSDALDDFLRGDLLDWLRDLQKDLAEEGLLREASEIGPAWPELAGVEALLADRALILARAGRVEETRLQVREIREKFPAEWVARIQSGEALEVIGDPPAAEALYRQCLGDLEAAKEAKYRDHFRKGVLARLIPLLRLAGKKAEARALQTASPRPPDDTVSRPQGVRGRSR